MDVSLLIIFFITLFPISILPGPSMLLALTHGVAFGARKALVSALANVWVTMIQAGISLAGLGALLATSELFFALIKWLGAGFLIYMGMKLVMAPALVTPTEATDVAPMSTQKIFWQSALVTAGNPKAILFFTAVFPQFMVNDGSAWLHSLSLLLVLAIVSFSCYMLYALFGNRILALFAKTRVGKNLHKVLGTGFVGFGLALGLHRA